MSDHIDRTAEVLGDALGSSYSHAVRRMIARRLDAAGRLASPEHDVAVAARALRDVAKIMRVCWDTGGTVRDLDDPATSHSADRWLEIMADHIEREGGTS